ncbi:MAG TPA: PilN domain-containing protein [bacterium]|nr:PilN domain-containing protein [bacterium]HPO51373.1 PilN domain-containing protein [bacterium]HXK45153.1 PilN domain-containing protein [bacterium]
MIEINLLKKRQQQYYQRVFLIRVIFIYIIGLVCILILAGVSFLSNRIAIRSTLASIQHYNQKIRDEYGAVQELEKYKNQMDEIAKRLFLAQEECKKRIIWGRKFKIVASSLPEKMWLGKISLNQANKDSSRVFVIEGYINSGISGTRKYLVDFMDNLKKNAGAEFSNISLAEIKNTGKSPGEQITTFRIECGLKGN